MKNFRVSICGPEEKRGKALKVIGKAKGSITAIETIAEGEENKFSISFTISSRNFDKNITKFVNLGDVFTEF